MSRIGKQSIEIPDKVKVNVGAEGHLAVEGPKGKLQFTLPRQIKATITDKKLEFSRDDEARQTKALHGLSRSLAANMITGVTTGYAKDLEIQGVGFKAAVQGANLNLSLGKSHPILFPIPAGIKVTVADNTKVKVEGIDKQLVGQVAADIRGYYPPEPYKGKGVRYAGEQVQRKEGKTVQ
jgi:large subunit ribosomal protein L6